MSEQEKRPAVELSHKATVNRQKDLADEIRRVAEKPTITPDDDKYLGELEDEFNELDQHRKNLERDALVRRVDAVSGKPLVAEYPEERSIEHDVFGEPRSVEDPGTFRNPWNLEEMRTWNRSSVDQAQELRARAESAIEKMTGTNDQRRQAMQKMVEQFDTADGKLSKQLLITSSPAYLRAFAKVAKGQQHLLTGEEQQAVERAMSLTDSEGGYLIPFQLDPAVIITSDGTYNQIRQAARQVVATGDVWNGVSSGAVSWSVDAQAAEVSDDATTFAQPSITIYKMAGFVPISLEALQDEANVTQEVGRLLAFGKDDLEAQLLATGTGSSQPFGIVGALNSVTTSIVDSASTDTFALGDVYALDEQLPARYRMRASWFANRAIYNDIRQFDTSGGAALWERLGNDVPPLLLGRPAYESENMDSTIATTEDYVLVFGDFSNYVIADRVGTTVEFIPHLFATGNNRPSGQRGWYAFSRMGADSVNDGAFRLLNVT